MFCTNCGQKIEDDSVFCVHCGARAEEEKSLAKEEKRNRSPILFLILGAIAIGGIIWWNGRTAEEESNTSFNNVKEETNNLWNEAERGAVKENIGEDIRDAVKEKFNSEDRKAVDTKKEEKSANETTVAIEDMDYAVEAVAEPEIMQSGPLNTDITQCFGKTREEIIDMRGEPEMEYEAMGAFPNELQYEDATFLIWSNSTTVDVIIAPVENVLINGNSYQTIDDIIAAFQAEDYMGYYVDEGKGDYFYGYDELVAYSTTAPYCFTMLYHHDRTLYDTPWIEIKCRDEAIKSTRVKAENIESAVEGTRERYNSIVSKCNSSNEVTASAEIDGVWCDVTANLDESGNVMRVSYVRNGDTYWYYYDYFWLDFMYCEKADGSAERWYFSESAYRIRVTDDASRPDDAYNYEGTELEEFMEDSEYTDIEYIELAYYIRHLFL